MAFIGFVGKGERSRTRMITSTVRANPLILEWMNTAIPKISMTGRSLEDYIAFLVFLLQKS